MKTGAVQKNLLQQWKCSVCANQGGSPYVRVTIECYFILILLNSHTGLVAAVLDSRGADSEEHLLELCHIGALVEDGF